MLLYFVHILVFILFVCLFANIWQNKIYLLAKQYGSLVSSAVVPYTVKMLQWMLLCNTSKVSGKNCYFENPGKASMKEKV